jgi:hypothetical protein
VCLCVLLVIIVCVCVCVIGDYCVFVCVDDGDYCACLSV